jgi:hypothetical protein
VVYPRQFTRPLLWALLIGVLLPFLMQAPRYVLAENRAWIGAMQMDDRHDFPPEKSYRDLQLVCRVWLAPISLTAYRITEVLTGGAMAALCCVGAWKRWPKERLLPLLFALSACWMTVLGPATESCTYILIAPAMAWATLECWRLPWLRYPLALCNALFLIACAEAWFPTGNRLKALGIQPLAGLLLVICVAALGCCWLLCDRGADRDCEVHPAGSMRLIT